MQTRRRSRGATSGVDVGTRRILHRRGRYLRGLSIARGGACSGRHAMAPRTVRALTWVCAEVPADTRRSVLAAPNTARTKPLGGVPAPTGAGQCRNILREYADG